MRDYKRLIEVDFPIREVSEHSAHDKSIKKGHLQRLHIWWARRPLASCRAILLAALFPDPADPNCPEHFRNKVKEVLRPLEKERSIEPVFLRESLLDFIDEFSRWENSNNKEMVNKAKALIDAAFPDEKPLITDPFAGGGSIPFEANRLGLNVFAMDLNPVAYLLLKVALEDIPKYGQKLEKAVTEWGSYIKEQTNKELSKYYPDDSDGYKPFVYLWARTVKCEGPNCGAEVPMVKEMLLSNRDRMALKFVIDKSAKMVEFSIFKVDNKRNIERGTLKRGSLTCPICGYTMKQRIVERQVVEKGMGIKPLAVILFNPKTERRKYRLPSKTDALAIAEASARLKKAKQSNTSHLSLIPDEPVPNFQTYWSIYLYGVRNWGQLFTDRQALALSTFFKYTKEVYDNVLLKSKNHDFARAVTTALALTVSNMSHYVNNISNYLLDHMISAFIHGGLGMKFDFAEANPLVGNFVGTFDYALQNTLEVIKSNLTIPAGKCAVVLGTSRKIPLPDESTFIVGTDPPYYDAYPYADLSDFFYVWLNRAIGHLYPTVFSSSLSNKEEEIVQMAERNVKYRHKTKKWFEERMVEALSEARRILTPSGLGVIVFAHKTTEGWEAMLEAILNAGWSITASWPIETERGARMRAHRSSALASSIHLVCRPRPANAGVGNWRDVLAELQPRVHDWMQRLVKEDIVGADAIFACIGPALEIFSRYERVETAGGEVVPLGDVIDDKGNIIKRGYLSYVWEVVAREALETIFVGADPSGFEEDSRLTAIWLWTLHTSRNGVGAALAEEKGEVSEEEGGEEEEVSGKKVKGFVLEYDAIRKIAQGLGAHLEELGKPGGIVEIGGKTARLLPVAERRRGLFGVAGAEKPRRKKREVQMMLFKEEAPAEVPSGPVPETGRTILDRLHQAMLLFADGRSAALKRFLVDEGVGKDNRFWRLATALSALYPKNVDEKRWVDGVLARKKSLGF